MKAWTVYWTAGPKNVIKKKHGCTTVVSDSLISAIVLFNQKFPNRGVDSISSESDEVLFDD